MREEGGEGIENKLLATMKKFVYALRHDVIKFEYVGARKNSKSIQRQGC